MIVIFFCHKEIVNSFNPQTDKSITFKIKYLRKRHLSVERKLRKTYNVIFETEISVNIFHCAKTNFVKIEEIIAHCCEYILSSKNWIVYQENAVVRLQNDKIN